MLAVVTILPIVYAAMLGVFFFVAQVMFVWHVREAVTRVAANFGMKRVPEVYVMQAGGAGRVPADLPTGSPASGE